MMLNLQNVTLCCIDTRDHWLALRSLGLSRARVNFAKTIFFTNEIPPDCNVPAGIEVRRIAPIASLDDYSDFVLKGLVPYVETDYVLVSQWDGYVINPESWSNSFFAFDYLGAAWPSNVGRRNVGNGGFSLRSRKLLHALQDPRIKAKGNEDVTICGVYRELLESVYDIAFGSPEIADTFSFEMTRLQSKTFGFHGLFNFAFVEESDALAALAPHLSDRLLRDQFLQYMLLNCEICGKFSPILTIGERILALEPKNEVISTLVKRARAATLIARSDSARIESIYPRLRHRFFVEPK